MSRAIAIAIATAGSQRPAEGSAWQLRLLGRPVLAVAERECSIALRPKDAALLAVVALSGPFQSAHLAAMLWPTATARQADTSLRQRLFRLRREAGQALVTSGTLMTLAPGLDLDLGATLEQIRVDEHGGRDELLGDLDFDDLPELAAWVGVQRQNASHDNELAHLALGSATIALKGQVNNFAEASLVKSGAGTLTHQGDTYTLEFGTLMLGAGVQSASLSVLNGAIGPSDLLSGAFDLSGATAGFTLSGFASFANLAAGSTFDGLGVRFDDEAQGTFLATAVLHAAGSNASGYAGALGDTFLVLRGDIAVAAVPEPKLTS